MSTAQLRNILFDRLWGIDDAAYLKAIKMILDNNPASQHIFKLSKEQKAALKHGRDQIKKGLFVSNADLEREEDEWLNR